MKTRVRLRMSSIAGERVKSIFSSFLIPPLQGRVGVRSTTAWGFVKPPPGSLREPPSPKTGRDKSSRDHIHLAAIDDDGFARDVSTRIRGQKQQHAVEIAVLAETAGRDAPRHLLALVGIQVVLVDLGHEPAGRDGVHPYPA